MAYTYGGLTLAAVGEKITKISVSDNLERLTRTSASATAPTLPPLGQLWYDTGLALLKINTGTPASPVWELVDAAAFIAASAPSSPVAGQLWYDTATTSLQVYNGTAWASTTPPAASPTTVSGTAPASPLSGSLWFDTSVSQLKTWDGSAWNISTIPVASETAAGKIELATLLEAATGTDTTRAVTPAGLKPIVDAKADINSPTFTGIPLAPTAAVNTNTTQLATTAFVQTQLSTSVPAASETVAGKIELATLAEAATGTDTIRAVTPAGLKPIVDLKSNLASPTFTGIPAAPTAAVNTNTTQLATTAFVQAGLALKSNLASPTFTGIPAAPTAAVNTNTTQLATTAFVQTQLSTSVPAASETIVGKVRLATDTEVTSGTLDTIAVSPLRLKELTDTLAPIDSPVLTGTPTAATAAAGTNTSQLATTAFVQAAVTTGTLDGLSDVNVSSKVSLESGIVWDATAVAGGVTGQWITNSVYDGSPTGGASDDF